MYDVPTKAMRAYIYGPAGEPKLLNEVMMFCPHAFNRWEIFERKAIAANIHYGDLHVPIGSKATAAQQASISTLMAKDGEYDPEKSKDSRHMVRWIGSFLVTTLLHEAMHAYALAGAEYKLKDLFCYTRGKVSDIHPGCMKDLANGKQLSFEKDKEVYTGHTGAEAFAMYAMTVYNNALIWYRGYVPYPADSWLDKAS
ncbi:hypothetical protein PG985_009767 [Apiospora marii]|uniref:uncharacterized protein n=1 Tax=Apiospora marii TaxID=335849 RepID=UPI0031322D3F